MAAVPARRATDIDDVLAVLDDVAGWATERASPLGYFAVLYRSVTAKVRDGIEDGFFDDGDRMARLDVVFANRYLDALERSLRGGTPTRSWALAFAATDAPVLVLQHLLVGINAHINLDLGAAVSETAGTAALVDLRADFDRINVILASMVANNQANLAEISPWLGLLDTFGGRHDDTIVRFSIEVARVDAWRFATELHGLDDPGRPDAVAVRDGQVEGVGRAILHPGWLGPVVWLVRLRESRDVRHNLAVLARLPAPELDRVEAVVRGARSVTDAGPG